MPSDSEDDLPERSWFLEQNCVRLMEEPGRSRGGTVGNTYGRLDSGREGPGEERLADIQGRARLWSSESCGQGPA